MTVYDGCDASIHLVYTDDLPHEPHHIHCWQHDQRLLSLASRSFCVVLANQRLVSATTDNDSRRRSLQSDVIQPTLQRTVLVLTTQSHSLVHDALCYQNYTTDTDVDTRQRCTCRHQYIMSVSKTTPSTRRLETRCRQFHTPWPNCWHGAPAKLVW